MSSKFRKLLTAATVCAVLGPLAALADLTSDAKMAWKLNEASGTTAADATGNGRDGTVTDAGGWTTGKLNNGYDTTARSISQTAYLPSPPFSVSLWFKAPAFPETKLLWWMGDDGAVQWHAHYISLGTSGAASAASVASNDFKAATSGNTASADTWSHIVCVWTSTTSRTVYLNNGTPVTNTDSSSPTGIDKLYVAKHGVSGGGLSFVGQVDEIVVFDVALDATQVATLYNGGTGDEYPYPAGGGKPAAHYYLGHNRLAPKPLRIRDAREWAHPYFIAP